MVTGYTTRYSNYLHIKSIATLGKLRWFFLSVAQSLSLLLGCLLPLSHSLSAQTADHVDSYDVVSIRVHDPADNTSMYLKQTPTGFESRNESVTLLLIRAKLGACDQITGMPDWAMHTAYDVIAKMTDSTLPSDDKQRAVLLLRLLQDRFGLKETDEAYQGDGLILSAPQADKKLMTAQAKMEASVQGTSGKPQEGTLQTLSTTSGNTLLIATKVHLSNLAHTIAGALHEKVVDGTQLPGLYSFQIEWSSDALLEDNPDAKFPDLRSVIHSELGLTLVKGKTTLIRCAVKEIHKPDAN